jgi:hypothetical protein
MMDLEKLKNSPHAVWCNQFDPTKSEMCSCHKKWAQPLIAELEAARAVVEAAKEMHATDLRDYDAAEKAWFNLDAALADYEKVGK